METKTCSKCLTEKPLDEFWYDRRKERPALQCRACQAVMRKAWKEANRDKVNADNREWQRNNPDRVKTAQERWKAKNPGLAIQRASEWYHANKTEIRSQERARYHGYKDQVYAAYGNACSCCSEDIRMFLSIDHVNNDGNIRRKEIGYGVGRMGGGVRLYKTIITEGFPSTYQILCMNCNWGKARNNGVCPHETVKVQRPSREGVGSSDPKRTALVCDEPAR